MLRFLQYQLAALAVVTFVLAAADTVGSIFGGVISAATSVAVDWGRICYLAAALAGAIFAVAAAYVSVSCLAAIAVVGLKLLRLSLQLVLL